MVGRAAAWAGFGAAVRRPSHLPVTHRPEVRSPTFPFHHVSHGSCPRQVVEASCSPAGGQSLRPRWAEPVGGGRAREKGGLARRRRHPTKPGMSREIEMEGREGGEVSGVNATMVAPCSGVVRTFQGARAGGVGRTVTTVVPPVRVGIRRRHCRFGCGLRLVGDGRHLPVLPVGALLELLRCPGAIVVSRHVERAGQRALHRGHPHRRADRYVLRTGPGASAPSRSSSSPTASTAGSPSRRC